MATKENVKRGSELEPVPPAGALARPSFIPQGSEGTENLRQEDIAMPRLGLVQKMSPETTPGEKYIEGIRYGDFFNSLSRENWGPGPIEFTVLSVLPTRAIEFIPMDAGGGIKDFNVPLDDPRLNFGVKGEKPIATKFLEFIIMRLDNHDIIGLSLKSSGIGAAKQLNGFITTRKPPAPSYAGRYILTSAPGKNKKFDYKVYNFQNAGYIQDEKLFRIAEMFHRQFKTQKVKVDVEQPAVDDDI